MKILKIGFYDVIIPVLYDTTIFTEVTMINAKQNTAKTFQVTENTTKIFEIYVFVHVKRINSVSLHFFADVSKSLTRYD